MANGNGATFKGPWWVTVVERTGSLGLVLVMLVGGFLIARDYTSDMKSTWADIKQLTADEAARSNALRQRMAEVLETITEESAANAELLTTLVKVLNERLDSMESRIIRLETQGEKP